MNSSTYKSILIIGIIFLIIAIPISFFGYLLAYNPPANTTITVNGVIKHPGDPGFQSSADLLLYIGLIFLLVSIVIFVIAFFVKLRGSVDDQSYYRSQGYHNIPIRSQSFNSFDNQPNSPPQPQHHIGFSSPVNSSNNSDLTCTACGAIIQKGETFCSNCGKRL